MPRWKARPTVVAEGPGHWRNVEFLVEESGLGEVLRKNGVRFVDLNHDEPVKVLNLGRTTGLEYLYLTRTITTADVFISLPKLKTHHWAGATLSLKNLFGTLPGICYGWPKNELHWRGIPNSIIDIALTQTPHLAIVDGIVGMEGDGPLNGRAKQMGVIVMGLDLVAVDATCCRLMGLPPERLPTLMLGADKRLGRIREADIPRGIRASSIAEIGSNVRVAAKGRQAIAAGNKIGVKSSPSPSPSRRLSVDPYPSRRRPLWARLRWPEAIFNTVAMLLCPSKEKPRFHVVVSCSRQVFTRSSLRRPDPQFRENAGHCASIERRRQPRQSLQFGHPLFPVSCVCDVARRNEIGRRR